MFSDRHHDDVLFARLRLNDARRACEESTEEAIRLYESIAEYDAPREWAEANLERAFLFIEKKRYQRAATALREAGKAIFRLADHALLLDLGRAWFAAGHPDDAVRALDRIVTLDEARAYVREGDPDYSEFRYMRAAASLVRGGICEQDDDVTGLITWLTCAVACRESRVSPYAAIELARWSGAVSGRRKRAEWLLREAMSYDHPDASPEAAFLLAGLLVQRGSFESARIALDSIVMQSGHDHWVGEAERAIASLPDWRPEKLFRTCQGTEGSPDAQDRPVKGQRRRRVLLVGGGAGGQYLVEDLRLDHYARERHDLVGVLDDDQRRASAMERLGVEWRGGIAELDELVADPAGPEEVWLAMPTAPPRVKRLVAETCVAAAIPIRTLPSMHDLVRSKDLHQQLRQVDIADLVGESNEPLVDLEASSWLRTRRVMIVGCGALGTQLALAANRGGADAIVLVDRDDFAAEHLRLALERQRGCVGVHHHQGSSVDAERLIDIAQRHACDVIVSAAGGWHGREVGDLRRQKVLEGLTTLVGGLNELPALEHFAWVSDSNLGVLNDDGDALDLVAETLVRWGGAPGDHRSCVVRVPPSYTSSRSVLANMRREATFGTEIVIPSRRATCRLLSAAKSAELVLASMRSARGGELLAIDGGDDVSLLSVAQTLMMLNGLDPTADGAITIDPTMRIDEAPRPVGHASGIPGVVSLGVAPGGVFSRGDLCDLSSMNSDQLVCFALRNAAHILPSGGADASDPAPRLGDFLNA